MKDQQFLDEIRRKIQASLAESEREPLSPEEEDQRFMDELLEFDRQLEEAPRITVRERIGMGLRIQVDGGQWWTQLLQLSQ